MIKSTKCSLKYSNNIKMDSLNLFIDEYKKIVEQLIDIIWNMKNIPSLLPKAITSQVSTWLSARMIQCAGKQASGIVRGTMKKQNSRKYMIQKLIREKKLKKARKLQKIFDLTKVSKPSLTNVQPELDSRFVSIDFNNPTIFDGWITLSSIGKRMKILLPVKKSKHFNKLLNNGVLKTGIRISKSNITFMLDLNDVSKRSTGDTVGIDIGKKNLFTISTGETNLNNKHGHNLNTILEVMSRKKKGSKGVARCVEHRKNYINWSINQIDFTNIKQINLENIKDLRRFRRTSRVLTHWTYTEIFDKLTTKCDELGVQVQKVSSAYTSQRCSVCGWVCKTNRSGKRFKCKSCGYTQDSDLNAAINISLGLPQLSGKQHRENSSKTGFYWNETGQDYIVPATQKT